MYPARRSVVIDSQTYQGIFSCHFTTLIERLGKCQGQGTQCKEISSNNEVMVMVDGK